MAARKFGTSLAISKILIWCRLNVWCTRRRHGAATSRSVCPWCVPSTGVFHKLIFKLWRCLVLNVMKFVSFFLFGLHFTAKCWRLCFRFNSTWLPNYSLESGSYTLSMMYTMALVALAWTDSSTYCSGVFKSFCSAQLWLHFCIMMLISKWLIN
jgi:hypothetical protein